MKVSSPSSRGGEKMVIIALILIVGFLFVVVYLRAIWNVLLDIRNELRNDSDRGA
jgi:hypothetical protein